MTGSIVGKGLQALKSKGIVYTVRAAIAAIAHTASSAVRLYRDYSSYGTSIFLGPERTLRVYLAAFKFRCKHNLFVGRGKSFWVGKNLKKYVYKVSYIDPAEVNYEIKGGIVPYIQDGDWDLTKRGFTLHETITKIFVDNIPASETEQYKTMKEAIDNKDWNASRGCRTQEELDAYFKTFEDIYRDFSNGRYRPQSELREKGLNRKRGHYPGEVLLSIDRNGNYMLESGGTHRLSIAKLLGLQKIPAVIIRKHYYYIKDKKDWLN